MSYEELGLGFLRDWIDFCQGLESRYGLAPLLHDWEPIRARRFLDQDEDGGRYALLDGVQLVWKRCHTWGNVVGAHTLQEVPDTYCPAPYDQFVILWNGDVMARCTDFQARTKHSNLFAQSSEAVWTGQTLPRRKQDMLEGRLLDVCARCQGLK